MPEQPLQRLVELADQCVKCGLCLPWCPTYGESGDEAESPRGRIALTRALADGTLGEPARVRAPLDHCLGCLSCQTVCPSGVRYDELLVGTRALLGPAPTRPGLLLALLKRPGWLRPALALARLTRADRWLTRLARRMPEESPWRAALQLLPALRSPSPILDAGQHGRGGLAPRGRVALFPGCVASVADAGAVAAARTLLQAAGFAVETLPASCCGAMDLHDGEVDAAARAARRLGEAWHAHPADCLVTVTPGCLGTLRRALPAARVEHAPALLAAHADALSFRPLHAKVALHLPCTEVNVAHDGAALQGLLRRVPGLDLQTLPAQPTCCGAAGSHMLRFPVRAAVLRRRKQAQVRALAPARLLSSNIGCRLHLAVELDAGIACEHPLVLLARQLQPDGTAAHPKTATQGSP